MAGVVSASPEMRRRIRRTPGQRVGYVGIERLVHGFVRAFARACVEGVPVELRSDVRAYGVGGRAHLLDDRPVVRARLEKELRAATRGLDNARKSSNDADTDLMRRQFNEDASAFARQIEQVQARIEALDVAPEPAGIEEFTSPTDIVVQALSTIGATPQLTAEQAAAFRVLVPSLRLDVNPDGTWTAEAYVRMVVNDGVAELGPIRWNAGPTGIGVAAMRGATGPALVAAAPRSELLYRLVHEAGVPTPAAKILTECPFPQLTELVLHARTGHELPEWVGPQWREPRFMAHVVDVYTGDLLASGARSYGFTQPRAQALVDCTAEAGELTIEGYRQVLPGIDPSDMWLYAIPAADGARYTDAVVDRKVAPDGTPYATNKRCPCGRPALIVIHVPEIPGALLCDCGLAVGAVPGSSADGVHFPDDYQQLRVSRERWMYYMRRTTGLRTDELSAVSVQQKRFLELMLREPGRALGVHEVSEQSGLSRAGAYRSLAKLARRDYLTREGYRPVHYRLVDVEDARRVIGKPDTSSTRE